jgi:hypothetical protein
VLACDDEREDGCPEGPGLISVVEKVEEVVMVIGRVGVEVNPRLLVA